MTQQRVFGEIVREYLRRITYGPEGWPVRLVSPTTPADIVAVDPTRAFGQPIFIRGGVRLEDVLDRIRGNDRPAEVAADMGVPVEDIEAVLSADPETISLRSMSIAASDRQSSPRRYVRSALSRTRNSR